jgi:hypothetical protein
VTARHGPAGIGASQSGCALMCINAGRGNSQKTVISTRGGTNRAERVMQVTYEDCLGMLDLEADEVEAVAQHEHIAMTVAVELADYLLHEPGGVPKLKHMIVDDLAVARAAGNTARVAELETILRHFVQTHPAAGVPAAPKD